MEGIYKEELKYWRRDSQRNLDGFRLRKLAEKIKNMTVKYIERSIIVAVGITPLAVNCFA